MHISPVGIAVCTGMHVRLLIRRVRHMRLTANKDACGRDLVL